MKEKRTLKIVLICIISVLGISLMSLLTIKTVHNYMGLPINNTISKKTYKNKDYYIIKDDYKGEYDLQYLNLTEKYNSQKKLSTEFKAKEIMNYKEYKSYCEKWGINKKYSDNTKNYIVFSYMKYYTSGLEARLASVKYNKNDKDIDLYIWDNSKAYSKNILAYVIIIPTSEKKMNINIVPTYTIEEYEKIKKNNNDPNLLVTEKPVIYLYPTEQTKVSVKLINDEKLTCSYPKYTNEWNVIANTNGKLIDTNTGRELYSLYYESENIVDYNITDEGFIVKGEETAKFLEEKLAVLGLTEREAEEFIIYWLPRLESNKYNYIRFATQEEINNNMPLEINPNPDTIIRVLMTYKALEQPIEIKEQKLNQNTRNGFTVVEWGGTEIK